MGRYKVKAELYQTRVGIVNAENCDEAIQRFEAGDIEEEWIEVGADDVDVVSVESLPE
jgi:hypothetical protein